MLKRKNKNATDAQIESGGASPTDSAEQHPDAPRDGATGTVSRGNAGRLGEILLSESVVTADQLNEALERQEQTGAFLGQALVELGHLDQQKLSLLLIKHCKVPRLNLMEYQIDEEVIRLIPSSLCLKYRILPIDRMGKILTLAMVDPLDEAALAAVRESFPELRIKPILADWEHFQSVYNRYFMKEDSSPQAARSISMSDLGLQPRTPIPAKKPSSGAAEDETWTPESTGGAAPADKVVRPDPIESVTGTAGRERGAGSAATADPGGRSVDEAISQLRKTMERIPAATSGGASGASRHVTAADLQELSRSFAAAVGEAQRTAHAAATSALDEKLGVLAESVRRVAEASDVLREARGAEAAQVAAHQTADLGGEAGARHGVVTFGAPSSASGGKDRQSADASVRAGLAAGASGEGFRLDTFIAGEANAAPLEIAKATATYPGRDYNPLFVYGAVGLGKTHLLTGIGRAIVESDTALRVGFASAGRFATHVMEARAANTTAAFADAYGRFDVLLLDDVQFLGGRVEAQEEFFHIFNALQGHGRQIVIASDVSPEKLGRLERRLVSRFEGGMVVQLHPPQWETRLEILAQHVKARNAKVPDDVLAVIASQIPNDVRRLIGALAKIIQLAEMKGVEVSGRVAEEVLAGLDSGEAA